MIYGGTSAFLGVLIRGNEIYGQSRTGGIDILGDAAEEDAEPEYYGSKYFTSGHQDEVTDLDWNENEMLLSSSLDMTARIFYKGFECGRPQTHGYSLASAKFIPGDKICFISAGQETILRIFEGTQNFFKNCEEAEDLYEGDSETVLEIENAENYEATAIMAELNLTNEIVAEPNEERLSENSLSSNVFKETKKLYGHYFEIKNIAVNQKLIFSCNKSLSRNFAGLFVWDHQGNKKQYLTDHELGIQKIAACSGRVLTVSRDKTACLYDIDNGLLTLNKILTDHTRAIWDCDFSSNSKYFATCARDSKIIVYSYETLEIIATKEVDSEVRSLAFSTRSDNQIVLGTISGEIILWNIGEDKMESLKVASKQINSVAFNKAGSKFAVGSACGLIRVFSL
ncbi:elongator complex protein 2 [Enteropsectra breve]|nr:elongator complex protein 2 [Enteropsectra breve]